MMTDEIDEMAVSAVTQSTAGDDLFEEIFRPTIGQHDSSCEETYKCRSCNWTSQSRVELEKHEFKCSDKKACRFCNLRYKQKRLEEHEKKCDGMKMVDYDTLGLKKCRKMKLEEEAALAAVDQSLPCKWNRSWGKTAFVVSIGDLRVRTKLRDSMRKVGTPGFAHCDVCEVNVSYQRNGKSALIKHMRRHKHIKGFVDRINSVLNLEGGVAYESTFGANQSLDDTASSKLKRCDAYTPLTQKEEETLAQVDEEVTWKWMHQWNESALTFICGGNKIVTQVRDCIRKIDEPGVARCVWCGLTISYGRSGKGALIRHMKTRKHVRHMMRRHAKYVDGQTVQIEFVTEEDEESSGGKNNMCECMFCHHPFSRKVLKAHEARCPSNKPGTTGTDGKEDDAISSCSEKTDQPLTDDNTNNKIHQTDFEKMLGTPERPFFCCACDTDFATRSEFFKHVQGHKLLEKEIRCKYCQRSFKTIRRYQSHSLRHALAASTPCQLCGLMAWQLRNVRRTVFWLVREHNCIYSVADDSSGPEPPVRCKLCNNKEFKVRCKALLHAHLHAAANAYPCQRCDMSFGTRQDRILHKKTAHNVHKFATCSCKICGAKVSGSQGLSRHECTCAFIKQPILCPDCNAPFMQKYLLKKHLQTAHRNSFNHITCPFCLSFTADANTIKRHITDHVGAERIKEMGAYAFKKCFFCQVNCHNIYNLVNHHMARHRGKRLAGSLYKNGYCSICGKTVKNKNLHMKEFHKQKMAPMSEDLDSVRAGDSNLNSQTASVDLVDENSSVMNQDSAAGLLGPSDMANLNNQFIQSVMTADCVTCPFCLSFQSDIREMRFHMLGHVGDQQVEKMGRDLFKKCFFCPTNCYSLFNLIRHMYARHKGRMLPGFDNQYQGQTCDICGKDTKNMYLHMKEHHQDKTRVFNPADGDGNDTNCSEVANEFALAQEGENGDDSFAQNDDLSNSETTGHHEHLNDEDGNQTESVRAVNDNRETASDRPSDDVEMAHDGIVDNNKEIADNEKEEEMVADGEFEDIEERPHDEVIDSEDGGDHEVVDNDERADVEVIDNDELKPHDKLVDNDEKRAHEVIDNCEERTQREVIDNCEEGTQREVIDYDGERVLDEGPLDVNDGDGLFVNDEIMGSEEGKDNDEESAFDGLVD